MLNLLHTVWKLIVAFFRGIGTGKFFISPNPIKNATPTNPTIASDHRAKMAYEGQARQQKTEYPNSGRIFVTQKQRSQSNKKHKNRVRSRIQRVSRKINLAA